MIGLLARHNTRQECAGTPEKIARNLSSAGLLQLFPADAIVSAQHVAHGKPAPDIYIEVLRRLECADPARAIVIEDAVHGLQAAKAAGAYAVGIHNTLPAHLLQGHADRVIGSLVDLDLASMQPE